MKFKNGLNFFEKYAIYCTSIAYTLAWWNLFCIFVRHILLVSFLSDRSVSGANNCRTLFWALTIGIRPFSHLAGLNIGVSFYGSSSTHFF